MALRKTHKDGIGSLTACGRKFVVSGTVVLNVARPGDIALGRQITCKACQKTEKPAAEEATADDRAPWVPASAKTWVEFYAIDEDGNHERDGMANYWDEDHAAAIARVIECRGHKAPHVPSRGSKTEVTEEWEDGNRATRVEFSRKEPQMGVWKYFAAIIRDV